MTEYDKIYNEVYDKYRLMKNALPRREYYQTKSEFAKAYYKAAVNMIKFFNYENFIERIRTISADDLTIEDYGYMTIFDRMNKLNDMKMYVFFQKQGIIRESQVKFKYTGFELGMPDNYEYSTMKYLIFRHADKIEYREIGTYGNMYSGDIGDIFTTKTSLHIMPNKKEG